MPFSNRISTELLDLVGQGNLLDGRSLVLALASQYQVI